MKRGIFVICAVALALGAWVHPALADQTITGDVSGGDITRHSDGVAGELVTITANPGQNLNISGGTFSTVNPEIYTNGVVTTRDDNIRLYNAGAGPDENGTYHMHTPESVEQAYSTGNTAQFAPANNPTAIPSKEDVLKALDAANKMSAAMRINAWDISADGNINVTGGNFDFTTTNVSSIKAGGFLNWSNANLLSSGGGGAMTINAREGINIESGSIRSEGFSADGPYVVQYDNRGRLNRDRWTLGNYLYFQTDGDIVIGRKGSDAKPEVYVGDGMVYFTGSAGGFTPAPGNLYINSGSLTLEGRYRSTLNTGSMAQTIIDGGQLNVITSALINRNGVDSATMYLGDTVLNTGAINLYNGQMGGAVTMNGGVINAFGDSAINSSAKEVNINAGTVNLGPKAYIGAIKGDSLAISPYVTSAAAVNIGKDAVINLQVDTAENGTLTTGRSIGGIYTINGDTPTSISIADGAKFNLLNPYDAGIGTMLVSGFAEADSGIVNLGGEIGSETPWYKLTLLQNSDSSADLEVVVRHPSEGVARLPGNDNVQDNTGPLGDLLLNGTGGWQAFSDAVIAASPSEAAEMLRQASGESVTANAYAIMSTGKAMEKVARGWGFNPTNVASEEGSQDLGNGNRLWINGVGLTSSLESHNEITGYWNEAAGLVAGFDHTFNENFLAGIALGYTRGYFESNDSLAKGHSDNWYASLYGSMKFSQLVFDADIFYMRTNTEMDTSIYGWTDSSDTVGASTLGGSLTASYVFEFNNGDTKIAPHVGIEYLGINQDSWSTGGYLPREFDGDFSTLWTLPVGVRFSHAIRGENWDLTCAIGAGYARDLNDFRPEAKVYMPGMSQTIDSKAAKLDKDSFRGDASINFSMNNLSIYVKYDLDARTRYTSHGGTLGFAWTF